MLTDTRERALSPLTRRAIGDQRLRTRGTARSTCNATDSNVWGSWCGPCRKEAPALRRVWEETRRQGVRFVGIDVKDSDASAIAFEREFGITYPSIRTADSPSALLAFGPALASAVPSTVVVDRQGRAAARVVGPTTYATLKALVDDVLAEQEASQ